MGQDVCCTKRAGSFSRLFDILLNSVMKGGTSKERMQLQEQRTVALLHIIAYFQEKFPCIDLFSLKILLSNSGPCDTTLVSHCFQILKFSIVSICLERSKKGKYFLRNVLNKEGELMIQISHFNCFQY